MLLALRRRPAGFKILAACTTTASSALRPSDWRSADTSAEIELGRRSMFASASDVAPNESRICTGGGAVAPGNVVVLSVVGGVVCLTGSQDVVKVPRVVVVRGGGVARTVEVVVKSPIVIQPSSSSSALGGGGFQSAHLDFGCVVVGLVLSSFSSFFSSFSFCCQGCGVSDGTGEGAGVVEETGRCSSKRSLWLLPHGSDISHMTA
mmetsp:Transcript_35110/g.64183  ORF Transcript_35110/g.64183 Transcript_35110/m.64183 type:complete len:206 (+) Transcript_35110:548-1165(+)